MRERVYFLMKARKTRLSENWTKYRYFRNLVTGKIRKAKDAYNRRVIEEDGHDSKAFWGTVKKLLTSYSKEPSLRSRTIFPVTSVQFLIHLINTSQTL